MMLFKKRILLFALTLVVSCGSETQQDLAQAPVDLEGCYGSEVYIKGLIKEKKLTVQLVCPIAWNNLAFEIKGQRLIRIGLLNERDTVMLTKNPDSLARLDGFGSFMLKYNRNAARLEAISIDKNTGSCSPVNVFRRINEQECKSVFELLETYSIRETGPLGF